MKASKAQLRLLLAQQNKFQENERARLARQIHDGLSQNLTALAIELALLQRRLDDHPESTKVGEILDLMNHASHSVRLLIKQIRPKMLNEFGIVPAIQSECQQVEKSASRRVYFVANAEETAPFRSDALTEIFRCFQEMLGWILAGGNGEISVEIEATPKRFRLKISSNHCDAPVETENEQRVLDLLNIQERALRLNGKISIFSGAQKMLKLEVPIPPLEKSL